MKRALTAVLAIVLVLAPIAPVALAGTTAAAPAGMATIPDASVSEEVPDGESIPLSASELEGGVMASEHADSLEVVLTTADHASTVMGSDSAVVSGDGMVLVLRDDQQSAGREVAIDAGQLQDALGYRPEAIRGTHEDGSTWTATAEYQDGYLVFDVPHFSDNTVTFSGRVDVSLSGATNGTTASWGVGDLDSASDPSVNVTGITNSEWDNQSASLSSGTLILSVGGNLDPTGPASGEPRLVISGRPTRDYNYKSTNPDATSSTSYSDDFGGNNGLSDVTVELTGTGIYDQEVPYSISVDGTEVVSETKPAGGYMDRHTISVSPGSHTITGSLDDGTQGIQGMTVEWDDKYATEDPSVDIGDDGSEELSKSGIWTGSETIPLDSLSIGETQIAASSSGSAVQLTAQIQERTETRDVALDLNGNTTTIRSGTLADGETASTTLPESDLSSGTNTLTTSLGESGLPSGSPPMQADVELSHSAADQVNVTYQGSTFEERYNVSRTFADDTSDVQVTIPFASDRVVGVKSAQYRVDGGSWTSVSASNYRFDGTTLDLYVTDEHGSSLPTGSTLEVRATGRKISIENGAVTVTDPTAPGEDLDTQLKIDSRSPGFAVNVGPTDDGDRVHYAYSDSFPTEDYVVIQANGDQQLFLPNSVSGDQFRVSHLDTRVIAEQGDVRIDVVEAGQNPELDVSPGPGGSGDPVTVEYYNTESGVEYILQSLRQSIVVDSDTAQSPAIFEDDDSDDRWLISKDSGGAATSDDGGGGAVGQFRDAASGAVGSVSLPIDGSGLGQLALVGVLGLGAVIVVRRLWPFGDDSASDSAAVTSSTSTGSASGSSGSGLAGLARRAGSGLSRAGSSLVSVGGRAATSTGSGFLALIRRLLSWLGNLVSIILGNRRASIAAGVIAAIVAARVGLFQLPEGTGILIVVSGVPLATWLIMRRSDAVSRRVWLASTIAAVILGLEFVAPGTVQTAIEQLTSEQVAPLLILVAAGGIYLWYRSRQSDRPQIIIGGDGGGE